MIISILFVMYSVNYCNNTMSLGENACELGSSAHLLSGVGFQHREYLEV